MVKKRSSSGDKNLFSPPIACFLKSDHGSNSKSERAASKNLTFVRRPRRRGHFTPFRRPLLGFPLRHLAAGFCVLFPQKVQYYVRSVKKLITPPLLPSCTKKSLSYTCIVYSSSGPCCSFVQIEILVINVERAEVGQQTVHARVNCHSCQAYCCCCCCLYLYSAVWICCSSFGCACLFCSQSASF